MFDLLTRHLLEHKKLMITGTGIFELTQKSADTDYAAESIAPPAWAVVFTENAGALRDELLISRICLETGVTAKEAEQRLTDFVNDLQQTLASGEKLDWKGLGELRKTEGKITFTADTHHFSPYTGVTARKIAREELASHETLVGHHLTTTSAMREKLNERNVKSGGGNKIMWILLGAALLAAAWYFSQSGCNKEATGNRQPVQTTAPGDTYTVQ